MNEDSADLAETLHEQRLLICAPAPVSDDAEQLKLDTKFVEGMHTHASD